MNNELDELKTLVDALDRAIPRDRAHLRIPGDPDGNTTLGTQQGYLRLGVEFLKAGLDPRAVGESHDLPHIPLDVAYLLSPGSRSPFELCELVDEVPPQPWRTGALGALGQLFAAGVAVVAVGLVLIGTVAVLSWIFH